MIYAIGLESELLRRRAHGATQPDGGLRRLADETGGGYFELKKTSELGLDVHARRAGASQPVRARLRSRAARRQSAQADGEAEAAGMTARARRSYLASVDDPPSERER